LRRDEAEPDTRNFARQAASMAARQICPPHGAVKVMVLTRSLLHVDESRMLSLTSRPNAATFWGINTQRECNRQSILELAAWELRPRACSSEPLQGSCVTESSTGRPPLSLAFFVSKDEEYVRLYAIRDRIAFDMGSRGHNYLLLTLARRRVSDTAEGIHGTARGWIHQEELSHDASMAPPRLNIDVFRIRRQFASHGLADSANVIERRTSTRQIRLGIGRIAIWPA
jgi:hypothetical protein